MPKPVSSCVADNLVVLPLIVVVGDDPALAARCQAICSTLRVLVQRLPTPFDRASVVASRPIALVVPARIHDVTPIGMNELSKDAEAALVRVTQRTNVEAALVELVVGRGVVPATSG